MSLSFRQFAISITALLLCLSCNQAHRTAPKRVLEHRLLRRHGRDIYKLLSEHHLAETVPLYLNASQEADELGDSEYTAKYLINAGGVQLMLFRYQDALSTMERARKAAEKAGDLDYAATANSNIASLYLQMGNLSSAAVAGDRALKGLRESHPQYARVLIPVAQVSAEQHNLPRAEALIRLAIDGAYRAGDYDTAAWALDYLGYRYNLEHRFAEADLFSYRIAADTEDVPLIRPEQFLFSPGAGQGGTRGSSVGLRFIGFRGSGTEYAWQCDARMDGDLRARTASLHIGRSGRCLEEFGQGRPAFARLACGNCRQRCQPHERGRDFIRTLRALHRRRQFLRGSQGAESCARDLSGSGRKSGSKSASPGGTGNRLAHQASCLLLGSINSASNVGARGVTGRFAGTSGGSVAPSIRFG